MDKPPVFGPNGSVLNSETMTDELRKKYREAALGPTVSIRDVLSLLPIIIITASFMAGLTWLIRSDLIPYEWLELASKAVMIVSSILLVWTAISLFPAAYRRWGKRN